MDQVTLSEIAHVIQMPAPERDSEGEIVHILKNSDLSSNTIKVNEEAVQVNPKYLKYRLFPGDIVVYLRNYPISCAVYKEDIYNRIVIPNTAMAIVKIYNQEFFDPYFTSVLLKHDLTTRQLAQKYTKTTSGLALRVSDLKSVSLTFPQFQYQADFVERFELIGELRVSFDRIIELRNLLLQDDIRSHLTGGD